MESRKQGILKRGGRLSMGNSPSISSLGSVGDVSEGPGNALRARWPSLLRLLALLLLLPGFGCSKSKDDLVKQLSTLNLQFNGDDFVRCAAEGDQKALTLFLQAGFDPNTPNSANNTALMAAAERGRADIVKLLLDNKANPNVAGRDGSTPLMVAAQNNQPDIVKLLLSRGADPNHQDSSGWTAVLKAAYQGNAKCIALLAAQSKLELDRALLVATLMERKDAVKALLDNGAEVDTRASDGRTPLMLAAGKGNKEIVQALLAAGADPSLTDRAGETAKAIAAAKGFNEIVGLVGRAPAPVPSGPAVAAASPGGSPQSSSSAAISDADILKMPAPEGANPSESPMRQQPIATSGASSMAQKISVEEVQEAFLPVTLAEVQGNRAVLKDADGSTYTVTVGDQLKGMSYRVVDIQARSVDDKDGNLVDASLVKLRHERTGQTISLIKGTPTREHGAYVVLLLNPSGQRIKVELDHDFSLPDEPGQTYRVLDIRPTQVVIKRASDGEVWTLQKGTSDQ
jgi:uncharacterized protein